MLEDVHTKDWLSCLPDVAVLTGSSEAEIPTLPQSNSNGTSFGLSARVTTIIQEGFKLIENPKDLVEF